MKPTNGAALTQVFDALFACNRFPRPLASAGVSSGTLATDRQTAAMSKAAVAADFFEAPDVLPDRATQLTFNDVVVVKQPGDTSELVVGQLASLLGWVDVGPLA